MVVFTCQHCGESLKKTKVEKHYIIRPGCKFKGPNLTCVDCLKDFLGNDYAGHTQCVSEAQRYSAKGTVFKEPAGQSKQAKYMELIQGLLASPDLSAIQVDLLTIFSNYENVPRKWTKFLNFSKNAVRGVRCNENDLKSVFDLIEGAWHKEIQANNTNNKSPEKNETPTSPGKENGHTREELQKSPENVDNSLSKKAKKKKHKENKDSSVCENETLGGEDEGLKDKELVVGKNDDAGTTEEITNGISKKERKKQKKYEKYLMELESVGKTETNNDMEVEEGHQNEIVGVKDSFEKKSKKKSKKSKVDPATSDPADVSENVNAMEVENPETQTKKKKKRKLDDSSCEIAEKRPKDTSEGEETEAPQTTFNWGDTIIRVLETRPDKELALKRLSKKVIDEYQTMKPADHRTYEQLLAKFNKKVKKTMGVRVFKDKAKLIE